MTASDAGQQPDSSGAQHPAATTPIPLSEQELASRFWKRVRLFALRRLRDASAAEDVAQEVMRRVVEAIRGDRIRNLAALPGFVFQTAHHVILQHHRGAGREVRALQRMHSAVEGAVAPTDPLALLITEERRQAVRAALGRLDQDDRELLIWLYQDHMEPVQVALRLAITPGALRVRKHRALKRLAALLGGAAGNEP